MIIFYSSSCKDTHKVAFYLLNRYLKKTNLLVFLLIGELGSGKTEFVKGIGKFLGFSPHQIKSPSFIITEELKNKNFKLIHIDFYRVEDIFVDRIIFDLINETNFKRKTIICIEWANKLKNKTINLLKKLKKTKILKINFKILRTTRKLVVKNLN
ncbi:MAG: tRNA (adenosine(37)-N6)-threonylcarbamoyltransferase complex ATPase subunit type 1 TsaE [Endomicrobiia bacterium]